MNWYRNFKKAQLEPMPPQPEQPIPPQEVEDTIGEPTARYRFIGIFETRVEDTGRSPNELEAAQADVDEFRDTLDGNYINMGNISIVSIDPPEFYGVAGQRPRL